MQLLDQPEQLLGPIAEALKECPPHNRLIVGVAGAPASGKSTLAAWLSEQINQAWSIDSQSVVVPMDGFHLDNVVLEAQQLLAVKGAPKTFDVQGFIALLQRLAAGTSTSPVFFPEFDRSADIARSASNVVEQHHRVVIVEGNYLLLQHPLWTEIASLLSLSIFLDVPMATLEKRLIQRWLEHGLDPKAARARALNNDIPNARLVVEESGDAHLVLKSM